jgi:hypothetical protein
MQATTFLQLTPWSWALPEKLLNKFPHFMKPEGSSPYLQEPATCPYPEPDRSSMYPPPPRPKSNFSKIHFYIILPSTPVVSFPQVSPLKSSIHLASPHICYTSCPSQSSWFDYSSDIWWGVHGIKLLVMYSFPLACYLIPLRPQISALYIPVQ